MSPIRLTFFLLVGIAIFQIASAKKSKEKDDKKAQADDVKKVDVKKAQSDEEAKKDDKKAQSDEEAKKPKRFRRAIAGKKGKSRDWLSQWRGK